MGTGNTYTQTRLSENAPEPPMHLVPHPPPDANIFASMLAESRLDALDTRVAALEESTGSSMTRLNSLEVRMASMDTHLEHILDETRRTNEILSQEQADRRAREEEEREASRDRRKWVEKVATEAWAILRQPLGLLVAAGLAYATWRYFGVSPTPGPVPVEVVSPTSP